MNFIQPCYRNQFLVIGLVQPIYNDNHFSRLACYCLINRNKGGIKNHTSFWDGISWIAAPISAQFWYIFHVFGIPFTCTDFASIFYQLCIDFWPPDNVKKPRRHVFYSMKHMVSVHSLFSNKTFFHERTFRTKSNIRFILASNVHQSS